MVDKIKENGAESANRKRGMVVINFCLGGDNGCCGFFRGKRNVKGKTSNVVSNLPLAIFN